MSVVARPRFLPSRVDLAIVALTLAAGCASSSGVKQPDAAAECADRQVHHETVVAAPVATAWHAWTTNEGLQSFHPGIGPGRTNVRLEPGGPFEFWFIPDNPPGRRGCDDCVILAFQHERMLAFTWDNVPTMKVRGMKTHVVVRFEPLSPTTTRVTLTQDGWGEGPDWNEAYDYFTGAWRTVLDGMQARFGAPPLAPGVASDTSDADGLPADHPTHEGPLGGEQRMSQEFKPPADRAGCASPASMSQPTPSSRRWSTPKTAERAGSWGIIRSSAGGGVYES